jgi:hypothetical protein
MAINGLVHKHSTVGVMDSAGVFIPVDSMAQTMTYNGPGATVDTITATDGTNSWRQTFTYTGANITGISAWIKL